MHPVLQALILVTLTVVGTLLPSAPAAADDEAGILVGRIAHIEGKLLRYVEEGRDWVATVDDAPFGLEDALYSGEDSRAEFIMPNQTWLRVGENTQIQLIALNPDATTLDVASGLARLYNRSEDALVKVTTPFGYVVAPADTVFDLYVGDDSLEVIAVRGDVDFVHEATGSRYEVREGAPSIIADRRTTAQGNGTVESAWDDWNGQRDALWAQRLRNTGASADYLPEPIRDQAYALEENGRWERVYYDGEYRDMWRPTRVEPGWRPYTAGRWSVYYGDNCWIPDEPFGYLTHHYGAWIYVDAFDAWYWAPPVTRTIGRYPGITIRFGWYPGRVGWFHSGPRIGWVPLAPDEIYYGYRPWGHRTVVVHRTTVINISLPRYRYLDRAVIIPRDRLYRGQRYTPYVQPNIGRAAIVNTYRPAPVVDSTVLSNFNTDRGRFALSDVPVTRKPHASVLKRIDANQRMTSTPERFNRTRIEQEVARINAAPQPTATSTLRTPTITPMLVEANRTTKPLNTLSLPQRTLKPSDRERPLAIQTDEQRSMSTQSAPGAVRRVGSQDDDRRMRAAREAREQMMGQSGQRPRGTFNRGESTTGQDANRQTGSLRETQAQRTDSNISETAPQDTGSQELRREQGSVEQERQATGQEENRRIRSPRTFGDQGVEQRTNLQEQLRQREETQRQQTIETQRRQQEEGQRQRAMEVQRRQQEEAQRQQAMENQRRQQEETQRQQAIEMQRRQQEEGQRQQAQEIQRRQQEEAQRQQAMEMQRRQQEEGQRQRAMEVQRRQQEEAQQRQAMEIQRRQQEEAQRQQQLQQQQQQQPQQQQQQQQSNKRRRTPQEEEQLQGTQR